MYLENTNKGIELVRQDFYHELSKTLKFCRPENIDFDLLICSLLLLGEQIETHLYYYLNREMKRKYRNYKFLQVNTIEQIFGVIDINLETPYEFNDNTEITLIDYPNKTSSIKILDDDSIEYINTLKPYLRGSVLV